VNIQISDGVYIHAKEKKKMETKRGLFIGAAFMEGWFGLA
jgi:hypothetical protein